MTGMMPRKITAVGFLGKQHAIETEDEVSAILEYDLGTIGHFFASTGEAAGANRLEIAGTRGKVIAENGELRLGRLPVDSRDFMRTSTDPFSGPDASWETLKLEPGPAPEHRGIIEDFARAVQQGKASKDLLAPAADDLAAMELSNAMLLAGVTRQAIELPMDAAAFDTFLSRMRRRAEA
jgi:predicted dehydrogenase